MVIWPLFSTLQGLISATKGTPSESRFSIGTIGLGQTVNCTGQSKGTIKCENSVFGSGSAHATKFRNLSRQHPSSPPFWRFAAEIAAIRRLDILLRVCYKCYKKTWSFWFGLETPMRRSRSKSAHECIPYNNRYVQFFLSRSVEIWQYEAQKPVL